MKEKIKRNIYKFIQHDGITISIAMIFILNIFKRGLIEKDLELFDWTILTSLIVLWILNGISGWMKKLCMNWLEDSAKLTTDYEKLMFKYTNKMITYENSSSSLKNLKKFLKVRKHGSRQIRIPVICEHILYRCDIDVLDSNNQYELPEIVKERFDELFESHSTSVVYNQLSIRVDDWKFEDGKFIIKTSRTTYYDSLVTNRAMDLRWENGMSIREKFEYGPFLYPLCESCLSNHIGFNGMVESADGYFVLVKRGKNLLIGKRTYGNSVSASLKTKYALNHEGELTKDGLINGIKCEIKDELKIPAEKLDGFTLIAAYRDVVEGGKPQLMFYAHSTWNKDTIQNNFNTEIRSAGKKRGFLEDGNKFVWIPKEKLSELCILSDMIIHNGKIYHMMPSATASMVMLIEYLKERE